MLNKSGDQEEEKHHNVKTEIVEDAKQNIGDKRIIWENKFVQLMNEIENLESVTIIKERRTRMKP